MSESRYDVTISLEDHNTSHVMVIELVGHNRRVLDVGCATGAVGEVLQDRGCEVIGIELDPDAAAVAASRLTDVHVGDVGALDLEQKYGASSFDVIVFADVLEHLADPASLLRSLLPLLRPKGHVILSVPNVAHGDVRLALLAGTFRYTEVGLLDRTHLRFFTLDSVLDLIGQAGLAAVEVRRTTAELFGTEVEVDPERVPPAVADLLRADPEARTYQFVVKAVRDDADHAVDAMRRRSDALSVQVEALTTELDLLRTSSIPRPAGTRWPEHAAQVALWSLADADDPAEAIRTAILRQELQRRLPESAIRVFAPFGSTRPRRLFPSLPIEALGPRTAERSRELEEDLDCVVVSGTLSARLDVLGRRYGLTAVDAHHPATFLSPAFTEDALPRLYSAVDAEVDPSRPDDLRLVEHLTGAAFFTTTESRLARLVEREADHPVVVPDPLLLAGRLAAPQEMAITRASTRTTEGFLEGPYIVVHGDADLLDDVPLVVRAVRRYVDERSGISVLPVNLGGVSGEGVFSAAVAAHLAGAVLLAGPLDGDQVLSLLAGASAIVTTIPWVATVASAVGRPVVLHRSRSGALADAGALLSARTRSVARETAALDAHFDTLADRISSLPHRASSPVPGVVAGRLLAATSAAEESAAANADLSDRLFGRAAEWREELARSEERRSSLQEDLDRTLHRLREVEQHVARPGGLRRSLAGTPVGAIARRLRGRR